MNEVLLGDLLRPCLKPRDLEPMIAHPDNGRLAAEKEGPQRCRPNFTGRVSARGILLRRTFA
jgi:hypothetical protein